MHKTFVKRLLELLDENDITQIELAKQIGITNVTISRYIGGERKPRIEIVVKMAGFFHVSTDYLLGLSDIRETFENNNNASVSKIHSKLDSMGLLNTKKELSNSQVNVILKLIDANKDFILPLKDENENIG